MKKKSEKKMLLKSCAHRAESNGNRWGQCLPDSFREKVSKPKVPEKTGSEKKIQKKMSQCSDMWADPR